ncbi:hypothetical protein JOS77_18030 [Chromobacterium haemolyticum]|nr:hypothetical protein JOS77_18030 [Chromobacterium haemolyticum]
MADQAFEQGNQFAAEGRWREAEQAFDQCLRRNAKDWQALANRANARLRKATSATARARWTTTWRPPRSIRSPSTSNAIWLCCSRNWANWSWRRRCCARRWRRSPSMRTLGATWAWFLQHRLQYQEAIACHLRAIELAGVSPARCNNLGYACTCALLLDDAIAVLQGGLELDPEDANLRFSLSIALLLAGRYAEAWPYYEARWEAILQPRHRDRRWQGEALGASTLLLWAEQGLGDSLQMARFLPRLRAEHPRARLLLACPKTFHRLFAQFDGVELLEPEAAPVFDCQLPLMSLPGVLGVTLDNLPAQPYLAATPSATIPRAAAAVRASAWCGRAGNGAWARPIIGVATNRCRRKSSPRCAGCRASILFPCSRASRLRLCMVCWPRRP